VGALLGRWHAVYGMLEDSVPEPVASPPRPGDCPGHGLLGPVTPCRHRPGLWPRRRAPRDLPLGAGAPRGPVEQASQARWPRTHVGAIGDAHGPTDDLFDFLCCDAMVVDMRLASCRIAVEAKMHSPFPYYSGDHCSPNAPGELRPTGKTPGTTHKAYAVGRQLHWVVRPGMRCARPDPMSTPYGTCDAPHSSLHSLIGSPRLPGRGPSRGW
jgi:hypothetical protein